MNWAFVQELRVLVDFPENNLAVEAAAHDSVLGILLERQNVGLMTVVRVHIHHFSYVPDFEGSVVARSVKLVILFVKLDASDRISVPQKGLNLLLVMDIPNPHDSVFSSTNQELAVS